MVLVVDAFSCCRHTRGLLNIARMKKKHLPDRYHSFFSLSQTFRRQWTPIYSFLVFSYYWWLHITPVQSRYLSTKYLLTTKSSAGITMAICSNLFSCYLTLSPLTNGSMANRFVNIMSSSEFDETCLVCSI